jgi:hypothetical protein
MYFLLFTDAVEICATVWGGCLYFHQTVVYNDSVSRYVQMEHLKTMLRKASWDLLVCQSIEFHYIS